MDFQDVKWFIDCTCHTPRPADIPAHSCQYVAIGSKMVEYVVFFLGGGTNILPQAPRRDQCFVNTCHCDLQVGIRQCIWLIGAALHPFSTLDQATWRFQYWDHRSSDHNRMI